MASSDLTLQALMAGGVPQNQDPALLGIMPKMKLAQAMLEEGTSTAPVASSKYGGLGKIAQALLGSYAMNSAQGDIADYAKQRQQNAIAANAFMSGGGSGQFMQPSSGSIIQGGTQSPPPAASQPPVTAPPSAPSSGGGEAANTGYGANLAAQLGIGPNDKIDLMDPVMRSRVVSAISQNEGSQPGDRSVRNNNPGNLEASPWTQSQPGFVKSDGRFAIFDTPENGSAAAHALLQNYHNQGLNTLNAIAAKWAPVPGPVASAGQPAVASAGQPTAVSAGQPAVASAGQPAANVPASAPTGLNSPMVQNALGMIHRAQQMMLANPYDPQIQALGHAKIGEAQLMMQLDTFAPGPNGTQINTRTGQMVSAAAPNPNYVQTPFGAVDTTGTHPPAYKPIPRVYQTPSGVVGAVGSGGILYPLAGVDNQGVANRAAASEQGSATGKAAVATSDKMFDIGREAATNIGNIDYGLNQLHEAAKGGINSGFFAPWLATAAAAGKSLGINLQALNIDPTAVGNVQSAQKTLGVVAGNILQNTLGKDGAITDAKIEHFIHTQPGIETDPQALERVLGWARSQYLYNHNMAMDAAKSTDPNTGMLSPGWRAAYVAKNGFAPIYDPLSGEMEQPAGRVPAPSPPSPSETPKEQAQPKPPNFREGTVITHPDKPPLVLRNGKWVPQ